MAVTYKLIQTITVGSGGAANIEFTSIPQTYTDLHLVISGRSADTIIACQVEFNGSTSSHSGRFLEGDGSTVYSYTTTSTIGAFITKSSDTASTFGSASIYIPNYTSSNHKSFSVDTTTENNATTAYPALFAKLWSNTSAITSILLKPQVANFAQYSSASLYGIKNS